MKLSRVFVQCYAARQCETFRLSCFRVILQSTIVFPRTETLKASTNCPVIPRRTMSGVPPESKPSTGTPQFIASKTVFARLSCNKGRQTGPLHYTRQTEIDRHRWSPGEALACGHLLAEASATERHATFSPTLFAQCRRASSKTDNPFRRLSTTSARNEHNQSIPWSSQQISRIGLISWGEHVKTQSIGNPSALISHTGVLFRASSASHR